MDAILEATTHIVLRHGYEGMTTNHVAERAGVSIGSLYQYFPSKEALVAAVLQKNADDNFAVMAGVLEQADGLPLAEVIRLSVEAMAQLHRNNLTWHGAIVDCSSRIDAAEWEQELNERISTLTIAFLERYRDEMRPGIDLEVAMIVIRNIGHSVFEHAIQNDPELFDNARVTAEIASATMAYLTGSGAVEPARASAA
ncbi:TetR/AcrR family transcriptional regulator [Aurantiacibacter sp. DGU5]|uniref:TetR/AcrR family transcriptional regulator n=1 Tax=Aurantiacibacter flavus TaxID=3145232 RepID=A0ABV0CVW2_9SPHN